MKGLIKINTYYYEEGNIHFNLKSDISERLINKIEDEVLVDEIINIIKRKESKIQLDLENIYYNFSDNYIKPLRRKLPGK